MALVTGQNALSTTPELAAAANMQRTYLEIKNIDAAIVVFIGFDSTLTSANGYALAAGASFGFSQYTGQVFAVAASGTPTIATIEW